jgi:biopolymer transport protein ExbB/TolQ
MSFPTWTHRGKRFREGESGVRYSTTILMDIMMLMFAATVVSLFIGIQAVIANNVLSIE